MSEHFILIRAEIEKRTRFSQICSVIDTPTDDELDAAIMDAVDDVNSSEPNTTYSLDNIMTNSDPRWKRMMYLGATINAIRMLLTDWVSNGIDVELGDGVSLASKKDDYAALKDSLQVEFDEKLERLKLAALKHSSVRHFSTANGVQGTFSRRARTSFKSSRIS